MGARPPRIFLERIRSQRAARAHHEDRVRGCGAVLRDPWSQQSDRRLFAGHRSRSLHRPPTWDLRLIASPPAGAGLFFQGLTPNGRNVIMVAPQTGQEVPPTPRGALLQLSKASPESAPWPSPRPQVPRTTKPPLQPARRKRKRQRQKRIRARPAIRPPPLILRPPRPRKRKRARRRLPPMPHLPAQIVRQQPVTPDPKSLARKARNRQPQSQPVRRPLT